jgi:hypothetical protein
MLNEFHQALSRSFHVSTLIPRYFAGGRAMVLTSPFPPLITPWQKQDLRIQDADLFSRSERLKWGANSLHREPGRYLISQRDPDRPEPGMSEHFT